eukprot:TRINITY_DN62065_c0_g1_i1.p1 TRINITY_DN62065_c0_g1~~TRINITY_DN62065_c0_g1_i1.p1  ORF type:complete len:238 (-),score=17.37 TRINITY_DN62065_c0_g1_i1:108-821(-)
MACNESSASDSDAELDAFDNWEDYSLASVPISDFPPLPVRQWGYWVEPWLGICLVTILSSLLVILTQQIVFHFDNPGIWPRIVFSLVVAEAVIAFLCVAYLLFGRAGEIRRSRETCYPLPAEVEQRLLANEDLRGLRNIDGPAGSKTLGTFCTRCLVWRPPKTSCQDSHHCSVCARCVTGFDHHCGVFGRCIVAKNMPCFVLLTAMAVAGFGTTFAAIVVSPKTVVEPLLGTEEMQT